jgi:hypothetical protein
MQWVLLDFFLVQWVVGGCVAIVFSQSLVVQVGMWL